MLMNIINMNTDTHAHIQEIHINTHTHTKTHTHTHMLIIFRYINYDGNFPLFGKFYFYTVITTSASYFVVDEQSLCTDSKLYAKLGFTALNMGNTSQN